MDDRLFRDAMGRFATGITVVTCEKDGNINGMTVNAFMSVSLSPKLITVSIANKASMFGLLNNSTHLGISILKDTQQHLSMMFAKQMEKDNRIEYEHLQGVPVLKDTLVQLACEVKDKVVAGDHTLFIAEVLDIKLNDGKPLVFFGSKYQKLSKE
jgi:flavin reductase (DIM6/NTAB) family NADH-FMN oxidoreductase RutF